MLRRWVIVAAAAFAAACAHAPPAAPAHAAASAQVRADLVPTGTLRVALYTGSPSSMVVLRNGEKAGVTYELAPLIARRLGVPVRIVEYARPAETFGAVTSGNADMTITNASEARMREADFSPPLVRVESGYLVTAASGITDAAAVDRPGMRVGVAEGGTSHAGLSRELKQAQVVPVKSVVLAAQQMREGQLTAFASNKAILFEMSDQVPGSRVLAGRWGLENLAIAVRKGRSPEATEWLRAFVAETRNSAELRDAISRAGLRGTAND
jgi:polar amino acid transport system substrate-binding protein